MKKFYLPYVNLPVEFITLLKTNLAVTSSPAPIFGVIRPNRALYAVLDNAFKEFDDGRGLEKLMLALGWSNFRERMASIYVYKSMHGNYPSKTNMDLVDDIKLIETKYSDHGVNSYSRLFLLGFYLKLVNLGNSNEAGIDIKIPDGISAILKLSQGRSEKVDWLILIVLHFYYAFGEKALASVLISGNKFDDIYMMMPVELRESMHDNLLAYGASIKDADPFLYEKI